MLITSPLLRAPPPRLLLITDPHFGEDFIANRIKRIGDALPPGALAVQLRDERRAAPSLRVFAARLRHVTRSVGAALVLNADPGLARDVGADGVHLGKGVKGVWDGASVADVRAVLGPRAWVSVPAHSDDDVRDALREGASAVLVSPVFATRPAGAAASGAAANEKPGRGLQALRSARACAGTSLHIYALGGIRADNARLCAAAGADGAALIRGLLQCGDPIREARAIHDAWARH
jgi:thiamine-phosphate pyrophosphorylase